MTAICSAYQRCSANAGGEHDIGYFAVFAAESIAAAHFAHPEGVLTGGQVGASVGIVYEVVSLAVRIHIVAYCAGIVDLFLTQYCVIFRYVDDLILPSAEDVSAPLHIVGLITILKFC